MTDENDPEDMEVPTAEPGITEHPQFIEVLRSIFENPKYTSYIRQVRPEDEQREEQEELSPQVKAAIHAIRPVATVSPTLKLAFWVVVIGTALCGLGTILIAFLGDDPLTSNQQTVFDTLNTTWKLGFAAIAGLIGGKVA